MAAGGIHDQLGGGFHRYATDAAWLVPHFEQMLYDNAQLARVYAHAWALTGEAYPPRDDDRGARLPAARADDARRRVRGQPGRRHRGRGGRHVRLDGARGPRRAGRRRGAVRRRLRGHRRGQLGGPDDPVARPRRRGARGAVRAAGRRTWPPAWRRPAPVLLRRRAARPQPAHRRQGARGLERARDRARSRTPRGCSPRTATRPWRDGVALRGGGPGRGRRGPRPPAERRRPAPTLVARRTARPPTARSRTTRTSPTGCSPCTRRRSRSAGSTRRSSLLDVVLEHFAHPDGGFYDTPDDGERLVVRPRDVQDNATPSGGAMATTALLRLAALTGEGRYRAAAERALAAMGRYLDRHPTAFAQWLCALELAHAESTEVAVVGGAAEPATRALVATLDRGYHPFRVQASSSVPESSSVPLLHGRFALDGPADGVRVPRLRLPAARSPSPRPSRRSLPGADRGRSRRSRRHAAPGLDGGPAAAGSARSGGPADPATVDDGVRTRAARLPRRRRRTGGRARACRRATSGPTSRRRSASWPRRSGSRCRPTRWSRCRAGSRRPGARGATTRASSWRGCPTAPGSSRTRTRSPTIAG